MLNALALRIEGRGAVAGVSVKGVARLERVPIVRRLSVTTSPGLHGVAPGRSSSRSAR